MLTRYSVLGPAAFVIVELPQTGTAGTGLDEPCLTDHQGIVTKGTFTVHEADGSTTDFEAGDAFYVPVGPPAHSFSATPGCIISGFAPITEEVDTSAHALQARGFDLVRKPAPPALPPLTVKLAGTVNPFQRTGAIDVEGSRMGAWLFMRSRFGPRSGYTGGTCDLNHWGIVLDGEIAIAYDREIELVSRGDVFFTPPGHRFSSPDGATIVDYTPIEDLGAGRIAAWRRATIAKVPEPVIEPVQARSGATSDPLPRARLRPALA
jgi:quercetin dioxygenase-like cupin family protein